MRRAVPFLALALVFVPSTALAQAPPSPRGTSATAQNSSGPGYTEVRLDGNQVVTFPDDLGSGGGPNPWGDVIRRPPGVLRVGLLRPRLNFVSEMLKSVENL
jgi:hypothetical protein